MLARLGIRARRAGPRRKGLGGSIMTEKPNIKWDDVAGLRGAKDAGRAGAIRGPLIAVHSIE